MAHLVGRQKLRLLFCCRAGLRVRLQRALRYGKAAPFGVPGGRRRFAASAWPQNQTKGTGLMAPSPWFVRAARARRPPGGTLCEPPRKRGGAGGGPMAAMGLPQRCQGLLVGCLGGLQLLGPMGFHLLKLELNRLDLLLDLGSIFRVGCQTCLHAG